LHPGDGLFNATEHGEDFDPGIEFLQEEFQVPGGGGFVFYDRCT
jgi:hypothetical protein